MSPTRRVALTYIVFFAAVGAYFPYLPVYYRSLGLGLGEIGLISAVWSAAQLLGAPAWGNLADRRSRSSWTLPAALLVAGVGAIALALSRDFPTVVASAVVMAFGLSGFGPVLDARSLELLGADRIRYGQLRAWGSASFVVATIGVGIVLDARGTEALFLICLPLFLLAAAVAGTLPRRGSAHVAVGFLSGTGQVLRSRQLAPFFASALLVLMGLAAVTAFSNAAVVMMSVGLRSAQTISTMRRPLALAMRACSESAAGIEEAPGSVIPMASAAAAIVDAVPMVMQVPNERAMPSSTPLSSASSMLPARHSAQYFQMSLPLPSVVPRQLPRSIGPAGTKIAGMFMLAAPISSPGTVLSHPPSNTAPSMGLARNSSSVSSASRLRYIMVVGFISVSPSESAGISNGKPPACHTPRFTSSARMRKCM